MAEAENLSVSEDAKGEGAALNEQELASLFETASSLGPLLQAFLSRDKKNSTPQKGWNGQEKTDKECHPRSRSAQRCALIKALMPYLSPERCRRAETALGLSALVDVLHTLPL